MTPIEEIAAERKRQIESEGWSAEHDDDHDSGELASAAACYAIKASTGEAFANTEVAMNQYRRGDPPFQWPWYDDCDVSGGRGDCPVWGKRPAWWKPKNPRRDLILAAALIVAEIERLDRLAKAEEADAA